MPPPKKWPDDHGLELRRRCSADRRTSIIKSPAYTHAGARAGRVVTSRSSPTGLTEPRWVRAIEIRPGTVKGRKITHHALARLQQPEDSDAGARHATIRTSPATGLFMEWAVGKQGEMMRPDTGKLMLPGSKIVWDIHYSAAGEEITNNVELGIYFYPKGQEPKYRQVLHLMRRDQRRQRRHSARTRSTSTEGFFVLRENGAHRELPAAHAPARQGDVDGSDPAERPDADAEPGQRLQLQLAQQLRLRRRRGAAAAEGHDPAGHGVARQHRGQQEQPRSESVGRLGRSHGRRDGARVGQHHLHERRRLQGRSREAQGGRDGHRRLQQQQQ